MKSAVSSTKILYPKFITSDLWVTNSKGLIMFYYDKEEVTVYSENVRNFDPIAVFKVKKFKQKVDPPQA